MRDWEGGGETGEGRLYAGTHASIHCLLPYVSCFVFMSALFFLCRPFYVVHLLPPLSFPWVAVDVACFAFHLVDAPVA